MSQAQVTASSLLTKNIVRMLKQKSFTVLTFQDCFWQNYPTVEHKWVLSRVSRLRLD